MQNLNIKLHLEDDEVWHTNVLRHKLENRQNKANSIITRISRSSDTWTGKSQTKIFHKIWVITLYYMVLKSTLNSSMTELKVIVEGFDLIKVKPLS